VYFIANGICNATVNVPFLKTVKDKSLDFVAPSEFQVIPFYGQVLQDSKDEMVYVGHPLEEIKVGDFFPPIVKDLRGTWNSYNFSANGNLDCISFPT
jgi:hypothetical protein